MYVPLCSTYRDSKEQYNADCLASTNPKQNNPNTSTGIHTSGSVLTRMWILWRRYQKFWLCCVTTKKIPLIVHTGHCSRQRSGLRSSSSTSAMDYSLPRLRTKFGERAFSHAGPSTWKRNTLPDNIRTVADPVKFRKLLKSHYFNAAFNICWLLSAFISFWLL